MMMQESSAYDCLIAMEQQQQLSSAESNDDVFGDDSTLCDAEDWRSARLSSSSDTIVSAVSVMDNVKVRELEEEQERLNNSLFSLTTHFAQVQFRLKQIAEANGEDKERLLKELQDFAFKGCADMSELKRMRTESSSDAEIIHKQKERQNELIKQLREQLEELEKFAYESGEGALPSTMIIQRQKAVLDNLREKMELNIQVDKMDQSDIQKQVEEALKQLINPFKAKEQLVEQLQTQIVDLERFVSFLQAENDCNGTANAPKALGSTLERGTPKRGLFGFAPFSTASTHFQKNQLKQTPKGRHYGFGDILRNLRGSVVEENSDERAHLQLAADAVGQVLSKYTLLPVEEAPHEVDIHEPIDDEVFGRSEEEVVSAVRKQLCPALRALLEHGMQAVSVVPAPSASTVGCFNATARGTTTKKNRRLAHIWDVILFFYDAKSSGDSSDAPVRMLSQSFKLDTVAGKSVTSKQVLLSTIESIIASHARLKRSPDAQWKAFVSAALNQKKLPAWIRIIFRTRMVTECCFYSWSYVSRTGCEELYTLLDSLQKYTVNLPVDLALRPFEQIKEAF